MTTHAALNRLAKWRTVFTGWQLGTRAIGDPEAAAVRDAREAMLIMRAEVNALTALCIEKGLFTPYEFDKCLGSEADSLCDALEQRFPGIHADDNGLVFDARAADTMRGWPK